MTPEFWHDRWQRGELGWHEEGINRHLAEHWLRLALSTVFCVETCGYAKKVLESKGSWCRATPARRLGECAGIQCRLPQMSQEGMLDHYSRVGYMFQ